MVNCADVTRYELLDRIGVGGMAEIFRGKAVAAGGFEKPVAIKRILPHLSADPRFVELLIAEAKVLSLLKHRNIVQIFDVGLGDDGKHFLVMEFVDGKDIGALQRVLKAQRRKLPFDLVLHIGAEICEALEHAVTSRGPDGKPMGLVHRDVSPSNVLISRAGEVKLTDFGIAKRAEQDATQGGAVRGKFAYISPEQARNEHLDPRSDVFSVGVLMWELLCNRGLFSDLGDLEALRAVREPQIRRPTELDPRLPAEVDDIVMTALARDKTRRWPSPAALGSKLRALRYSLDVAVGDPATELAKIIASVVDADGAQRAAVRAVVTDFDASEATVIRIQTADAFGGAGNEESAIIAAREVIDRFEDEETRLAQLSGDQLRMLRATDPRAASGPPAAAPPKRRTRAPSDEATRALAPIFDAPDRTAIDARFDDPDAPDDPDDDPPTVLPITPVGGNTPPHQNFNQSEATRLYQRTPRPQPTVAPRAPVVPVPPTHLATTMIATPNAPGGVPAAAVPMAPLAPWGPPVAAQQARPSRPLPPPAPREGPSAHAPRLQPWMLVAGAVLVALLAFAITRAFIR
jgi:hypothetical protein